jgi:hypothetical protein
MKSKEALFRMTKRYLKIKKIRMGTKLMRMPSARKIPGGER